MEDSWQKVQQSGILRVVTIADYPLFEYCNAQLNYSVQDRPNPEASDVVKYALFAYNNGGHQEARNVIVKIVTTTAPPPPMEPLEGPTEPPPKSAMMACFLNLVLAL